jgi:hypothetical protein
MEKEKGNKKIMENIKNPQIKELRMRRVKFRKVHELRVI